MRKSKGDALLERIVFEAAKEKSAAIRQEEIELNKEPIPEEARARFMRELDKIYPEGGKKAQQSADSHSAQSNCDCHRMRCNGYCFDSCNLGSGQKTH